MISDKFLDKYDIGSFYMKIHEISLTKDIQQVRDTMPLIDIFGRYGWQYLGKGNEAAVAQHPNKDYVIKVFESASPFKEFYKICQEHPNIHYPKFLSKIKIVPNTQNYWSFVRMEKLQKINDSTLLGKYFPEVIYTLDSALKARLKSGLGGGMHEVIEDHVIKRFGKNIWDRSGRRLQVNKEILWTVHQSITDTWKEAVKHITDKAVELNLGRLDLHASNFMTRGSTLVILDPLQGI